MHLLIGFVPISFIMCGCVGKCMCVCTTKHNTSNAIYELQFLWLPLGYLLSFALSLLWPFSCSSFSSLLLSLSIKRILQVICIFVSTLLCSCLSLPHSLSPSLCHPLVVAISVACVRMRRISCGAQRTAHRTSACPSLSHYHSLCLSLPPCLLFVFPLLLSASSAVQPRRGPKYVIKCIANCLQHAKFVWKIC